MDKSLHSPSSYFCHPERSEGPLFSYLIKEILYCSSLSRTTFMNIEQALKELQVIPGVGKSVAQDLVNLGIFKVSDLKNKNPQEMYDKSCLLAGAQIDRCLLYVYRCAVYYASNKKHNPEKLKWWNWKDKK